MSRQASWNGICECGHCPYGKAAVPVVTFPLKGLGPLSSATAIRAGDRHNHSAAAECLPECPAHNPDGWRCGACGRQRPMAADTEGWIAPVCDACFLETEVAP